MNFDKYCIIVICKGNIVLYFTKSNAYNVV